MKIRGTSSSSEYLIGLSIDGDGETGEKRFPACFRVNPARSPEHRVQPAGPISLDVYQRRPTSLNSPGERENADGLFINQSDSVGDSRD